MKSDSDQNKIEENEIDGKLKWFEILKDILKIDDGEWILFVFIMQRE